MKLYRTTQATSGGLPVELLIGDDGEPLIFYGHSGITYEQGQYLKRWAEPITGEQKHHILTDTGPDNV